MTEMPQIEPFAFNQNGMNGLSSVRLLCSIIAGDLPVNISWQKDGEVLPTDDHRVQQLDEATVFLSLSRLLLTDSGNYTCVASNIAGVSSHSSLLQVKGICLCKLQYKKNK